MSSPNTIEDWFATGVAVGLREPLDASLGSPPLASPWLESYDAGVEAARQARRAYDEEVQSLYSGPSVAPMPDVVISIEEYEEPARSALEALFHKHMPHVELPEYDPTWYPPQNPIEYPIP
jgi:hypothetical protein